YNLNSISVSPQINTYTLMNPSATLEFFMVVRARHWAPTLAATPSIVLRRQIDATTVLEATLPGGTEQSFRCAGTVCPHKFVRFNTTFFESRRAEFANWPMEIRFNYPLPKLNPQPDETPVPNILFIQECYCAPP
ncbi:MAG: hypothetical protein NZ480_06005, partial [Bdellovibrionaceae bacterium]|nr:hypothetical protein [Pseudobdellovibrionaceae bacterium]